jgi:hypothetical protein
VQIHFEEIAMTDERRRTRRSQLSIPVMCSIESHPGFAGMTMDISPTGLLVQAERRCELGTKVTLTFESASFGESAVVPARVRRVVGRGLGRPAAIGISFDIGRWSAILRMQFLGVIAGLIRSRPNEPSAPEPERTAPPAMFFEAFCQGCGWRGRSSRYARICPRCKSTTFSVAPSS